MADLTGGGNTAIVYGNGHVPVDADTREEFTETIIRGHAFDAEINQVVIEDSLSAGLFYIRNDAPNHRLHGPTRTH